MKSFLRKTLTVAAAGSILFGVAGCGGGEEKQAAESAAPVENTEGKNSTFSSAFQAPAKVPEKWDGGAGWSEDGLGKLVALPKAIAYTTLSYDENTHFYNSNFFMYDVDGKVIGKSEEAKELDSKSERIAGSIVTTTAEGRTYLVYAQQGISKPDPTSTKKASPLIIVSVFDEEGKQISRKTFDIAMNGPEYGLHPSLGAATIVTDAAKNERLLIDPIDGSADKLPTSTTAGAEWAGQVDGVNLFYVPSADAAGKTPGSLTNGSWTLPVNAKLTPFSGFAVKGPYLSLVKASGDSATATGCIIINAHTGNPAPGSEQLGGACAIPESANPAGAVSTVGGFIAEDRSKVTDSSKKGTPVMYDPALGKVYAVPAGISFNPITPSEDGTYYGTAAPAGSDEKVASHKLEDESDPKVLVDVQRAPLAVSGNGIAVFSKTDVATQTRDAFVMVPKK